MYLTKVLHFSAAHRLASPLLSEAENRAVYGQCYRAHGHNYALEVTVRGRLRPDGTVMDLGDLERAMRTAVVDLVDHHDLDRDLPVLGGAPSTGENLAVLFRALLAAALPQGTLHRVAVVETRNNRFAAGEPGSEP